MPSYGACAWINCASVVTSVFVGPADVETCCHHFTSKITIGRREALPEIPHFLPDFVDFRRERGSSPLWRMAELTESHSANLRL